MSTPQGVIFDNNSNMRHPRTKTVNATGRSPQAGTLPTNGGRSFHGRLPGERLVCDRNIGVGQSRTSRVSRLKVPFCLPAIGFCERVTFVPHCPLTRASSQS